VKGLTRKRTARCCMAALLGLAAGQHAFAQATKATSAECGVTKERIERLERGIPPISMGKGTAPIVAFSKNVEEYPESSTVYDSLAEADAAAGKKELAIENYEKSMKLNSNNQNAMDWMKKLCGEP